MVKDDQELVRIVCERNCRFYKPGEKEEMTCRGYDFLADVMEGQGPRSRAAIVVKGMSPPKRFEHDPRIEALLCGGCDFRKEDCDFMSGEEIADAVPCGGYVLIARLLANGVAEAEVWLGK